MGRAQRVVLAELKAALTAVARPALVVVAVRAAWAVSAVRAAQPVVQGAVPTRSVACVRA